MSGWKKISLYLLFLVITSFTIGCSDTSTGPDGEQPPPFNSRVAPGDSAHAFLSGQQFPVLNLEVDYMEGYEPEQQALDSLKTFLQQHLNKTTVNIGLPNSIPAEGQNAYSADDIRSLEEEHRDHFTDSQSDTLWAYFIVVDGEFTEQNVLGIAYYNTSMGFFGETIQNNSGGTGQPPRYKMEAIVFNHEFGHNLGLVNNGSPMQQDHQDEAHGKHCDVEECLMYYTVETTDFFANLFDGSIPDLQQFCNADLDANGGR